MTWQKRQLANSTRHGINSSGNQAAAQQLNEADLPTAPPVRVSLLAVVLLGVVHFASTGKRLISLPLGGAGFQRFYVGEIARRDLPESLSMPAEISLPAGLHTACLRRPCLSHRVGVRKPRFERQARSQRWAAQPAHAADHLPRRGRSILALVYYHVGK